MKQYTQTKQQKSENEEKKFYRIGYWLIFGVQNVSASVFYTKKFYALQDTAFLIQVS